jgi:hypothetical protein
MPLQRGQKIGEERKKGATNIYLGQRRFSLIHKKKKKKKFNYAII